jgi:hypothetical protein
VWNISCGRQQQANIQYSSVWNLCRINFNRHYLFWLTTWDGSLSVRFSKKKLIWHRDMPNNHRTRWSSIPVCIGFVPLDFLFLILCIGCCFCVVINEQLLLARILSHFSEFIDFPSLLRTWLQQLLLETSYCRVHFFHIMLPLHFSNPFHITWTF